MLPVTSTLAPVAAVALVALSISVSFARMRAGVPIGLGEDPSLLRRIRAQGNFIEYVPMALILLGLAEYREAPLWMLMAGAALLVIGRILHVAGILTGTTALRAPGMVCTYLSLLVGAAGVAFA